MPKHEFLIRNQHIKDLSVISVFHDSSMVKYLPAGLVSFHQ